MRLDAFLLADHANVAEGKLYVNGGGITRLNVPQLPFAMPTLSIVTRFLIDSDDDYGWHDVGVQLTAPSGLNLLPFDLRSTGELVREPKLVEGEEQSLQINLMFSSIPIPEEGVYTLTISLDGEVQRTMTLPVVVVPFARPGAASRP